MEQGAALFFVRAVVADPQERPRFDEWYRSEHLPEALAALRPARAWRSWSRTDACVHFAFYAFPSLAAAQAALRSEAMQVLIVKFDEAWGARVARDRTILEVSQALTAADGSEAAPRALGLSAP